MITTTHRIPPGAALDDRISVTMTIADLELIISRALDPGGTSEGTTWDLTRIQGLMGQFTPGEIQRLKSKLQALTTALENLGI